MMMAFAPQARSSLWCLVRDPASRSTGAATRAMLRTMSLPVQLIRP